MEPGGERPPCDDLVACSGGPGDCAACERATSWTHKLCHVHLCSAACVADAAKFVEWSIAEAAKKKS